METEPAKTARAVVMRDSVYRVPGVPASRRSVRADSGGSLRDVRVLRWLRSLREGGAKGWSLFGLASLGFLGYYQLLSNTICVFAVLAILLVEFSRRIDRGLPMMQVAASLACLQWLVGPIWYYLGEYNLKSMGMAVDAQTYFKLALPGTAAFAVGLLSIGRSIDQMNLLLRLDRSRFFWIGSLLNIVAAAGDVGARVVPDSLAFALLLVSQLRYVGFLYLLFSPNHWAKPIAALSLLPLLNSTAESAMFHDLLLWTGILFCYWFAMRRRSLVSKVAILVASSLLAFTIQGIKESYRSKVWEGKEASMAEDVSRFWQYDIRMNREDILENAMTRMNQGWIVSCIQAFVPVIEPYAHGETVRDAVAAALLPRFVSENKAKAGGRVNFVRFTGIPLNETTSMNISLLGEGYANFGRTGAIIFLGTVGLGMAGIFLLAVRWTAKHPLFLFWIPLIFYQGIKAETDLTEILNQIVKGGMVAFGCFFVVETLYPTVKLKIRRRRKGRTSEMFAGGRDDLVNDSEEVMPVTAATKVEQ